MAEENGKKPTSSKSESRLSVTDSFTGKQTTYKDLDEYLAFMDGNNTSFDNAAKKSSEKVIDPAGTTMRNDAANYIKDASQGPPRQSNESKAQDKIAKMFENTYAPEGDAFFNMGYGLRKAFDKKRQAKAEKAGFDNITDYKGAMKEERQVNRTNRKQERKEDKQAKKSKKRTY
jgi:hypothetical protein